MAFELARRGEWLELLHPDDRKLAQIRWAEARKQLSGFRGAYRLRTENGGHADFLIMGAPILNSSGQVREWFGILFPATAELNDELRCRLDGVLTGDQCRAGRALLNWSVEQLASAAGVSASSIRRLESGKSTQLRGGLVRAIATTLRGGGVVLLWPVVGKPGVAPA